MSRPLRVGVVGMEPGTHWNAYLAATAETAAEIAAIAVRPEVRVQAATALEQALEQAQAAGAMLCAHPADVLERDDLDVLAICTVPDEQAALAVAGLRRGLHVVADKPLATTWDGLRQVEQALREHPQARLSMLLTLRGDPVRVAARRLAQSGAIGQVVSVSSRRAYQQRRDSRPSWFFDEARSGGPWLDGAIHGIDEVLWITGQQLERVTAHDVNVTWPEQPRFYDAGHALLRLDGGALAVVEHQRLALVDCTLSILGTEGRIDVDRHNHGVLVTAAGETPLEQAYPLPKAVNVFADFVEAVRSGRPALVDTQDVLATMRAALLTRDEARVSVPSATS